MDGDQCGFSPNSNEVERWWETDHGSGESCTRDVWKQDRCIWHAIVRDKPTSTLEEEAKSEDKIDYAYLEEGDLEGIDLSNKTLRCCNFGGANLSDTELSSGNFNGSLFTNADLSGQDLYSCKFHDCRFDKADLSGSRLFLAEFDGSSFRNTNLTQAQAARTSFVSANLEGAIFRDSVLGDTEFTNSNLYNIVLENARINEDTVFDEHSSYEESDEYRKAARVYRELMDSSRRNSLATQARYYYVKEKHARRKCYELFENPLKRIMAETSRGIMLYGDSPWRVISLSVAVILSWSIIFKHHGEILYNGEPLTSESLSLTFGHLYFSLASFVTLTPPGYIPGDQFTRIFAGIESLIGGIFLALLVFVLSRRAIW